MSLNFIAEVWEVLSSHISSNERADASDALVNLLIDNDYEAEDIKESFRGEKEILQALKYYVDQHDTDEDEDEDEDDYEEWD